MTNNTQRRSQIHIRTHTSPKIYFLTINKMYYIARCSHVLHCLAKSIKNCLHILSDQYLPELVAAKVTGYDDMLGILVVRNTGN